MGSLFFIYVASCYVALRLYHTTTYIVCQHKNQKFFSFFCSALSGAFAPLCFLIAERPARGSRAIQTGISASLRRLRAALRHRGF